MYLATATVATTTGTFRVDLRTNGLYTHVVSEHGPSSETVLFTILAWTSLLGDSPLGLKTPRVICKFMKTLALDYRGTIKALAEVGEALEASPSPFVISDELFHKTKRSPLFRELLSFSETGDPGILRWLLTFCYFGKKAPYVDSALDSLAFRKWEEVETRLHDLRLPMFVESLRCVIEYILADAPDHVFLPSHGSGAVCESGVRGTQAKNESMALPTSVWYLYGRPGDSVLDQPVYPVTPVGEGINTMHSRLKFVPKNWKTTRSICMEPAAVMWAQQSVRIWLERIISTGPLQPYVTLKDQSTNQRLALYGSRTNRCDTIDLSAASDSVSWALVQALFPAKVLKHLTATRTSSVMTPAGDVRRVHKFAPMGSAVCFPIQSIIYAAVVVLISLASYFRVEWQTTKISLEDVRRWWPTLNRRIKSSDKGYMPFAVYGDDIVCDSRLTSSVTDALAMLGFAVNLEKSFTGDLPFRESCGIRAYKGHDVTNLTFKPPLLASRHTITDVANLVDLANRSFDYGYTSLRRCVIQRVLHTPVQGVRVSSSSLAPILFKDIDDDDTFGIKCLAPRNTHLRSRYNKNLQRRELRSLRVGATSKQRQSSYDGYFYAKWWRNVYLQDCQNDNPRESNNWIERVESLRVGTAWGWTPKV